MQILRSVRGCPITRINRQRDSLAIGVWLLLWIGLAAAAPRLDLAEDALVLGPVMQYLVDPDHTLTLEQVQATPDTAWTDTGSVPNFGFRRETFWFRVTIENPEASPRERLLELSYPMLDQVDLFQLAGGERLRHERVGDDLPFDQRPIQNRYFVFPLELQPGSNTLYLRIDSEGVMQAPLTLWPPLDFLEFNEQQSVVEGAYFGVMLIMVFYNMILYFGLRERAYLWYVGHVSSATLFLATLHGMAFMYLWPDWVWWQSRAVPVLVSLSVVFIALFVSSFLRIEQGSVFGRIFRGLMWTALGSTALSFLLPYEYALRLSGSLSVLALTVALVASLRGWLAGHWPARFLVLAWTVFVLGSLALAFNKFGLLPRTAWTESGMLFGSMLDVVLLSIAMADRVRQERTLRESAQRQAMDTEREARASLEQAVTDRTEQLQDALGRLRDANQRLEALSQLDGLTEVHNRRYFDQGLGQLWESCRDGELSLLIIDADHFKEINDSYGHQCGDEVLKGLAQRICESVEGRDHLLARIGGEEFALLLPDTTLAEAGELAERIRGDVKRLRIEHDGRSIPIAVSIGVASSQGLGNVAELVSAADEQLYVAKKSGRNRVAVAG